MKKIVIVVVTLLCLMGGMTYVCEEKAPIKSTIKETVKDKHKLEEVYKDKEDESKTQDKKDTDKEHTTKVLPKEDSDKGVDKEDNLKGIDKEKEGKDVIKAYVKQMTLEEKIGQMFMVAIRKDAEGNPITKLDKETLNQIKNYKVGGVILFKENIVNKEQTVKLIKDLQKNVSTPLWIGVDEEGGMVSRVGSNPSFRNRPFIGAYESATQKGEAFVYKQARELGEMLKEVGFNMDFAPVADIYNEPTNTVIGKRSFGTNSKAVVPMVLAFSKGLKESGVQPVVKHFPGHGNTVEDSHEGIAYVHKSKAELEKEELIPFQKSIEAKVGALMKGHLMVPAIDNKYMASLSAKWGAYIEKHYDTSCTLLMTDAMDMGAITKNYTSSEAAILSILAGNDILLMPEDLKEAYQGVLKACKTGKITEERIDASVTKIISKKVAQHIMSIA